jgi:large subunit ribosomal protein L32
MANQKWRFSKSRTRKRRSQYKIKTVKGATCPNCGSPMIYHHVCPECGFYRGKLAIEKNK